MPAWKSALRPRRICADSLPVDPRGLGVRMRKRAAVIALMACLCGAGPAAAAEPPAEQRRVFEDYGNVTEGSVDDAGAVCLKLWEPYVRYRIPPQSDEKSKALLF